MYYTSEDFLETDSPEVLSVIARARELTRAYYLTDYQDRQKRYQILSELFGGIGENVVIDTPFHCDYGKNIFLGDDIIINMNCTFVDNKPIRIGNRVLMHPMYRFILQRIPFCHRNDCSQTEKTQKRTFFGHMPALSRSKTMFGSAADVSCWLE